MAANFQQHMGGVGQMMPQQQQRQQQPQRPPQQGNPSSGIQQLIYQTLTSQTGPLNGWQANVLIQERMSLVFNIIGNLRLASQHQPNPPTLNKMIEIGIKFEKEIFEKSPDKATYKQEVQMKLDQLLAKRSENQQHLQQSITLQAQQQAQAQAQAAQNQQMMMNQNGMQGQVPRNMPQQSAQQGFHHLQHQMQPSPLPGQQLQPPQMPMGMQNDAMPPNMTPNQQQQFMVMQQSQQQPQQSQNVPGRLQNGPGALSQQEMSLVMELATKMMGSATEQEKASLRANLQAKMDPPTFQRYQQQGMDPVFLFYRNQAMQKLRIEKQQRMAQAQSQLGMSQQQQSQNVPTTAPLMQQQRSMNPSPLNGQTQPPTSMGGNGDLNSFMGNMGNLIDQQQQGVMAQEAGQMVVPVSGAQRNATPQPGVMPGQQMNANDQRAGPNARAQQQQHLFNAQQAQQAQAQRMQFTAQQQSQAAARANAQAKAQQMALQGQPGGMGNGPMPPQQSPAMGTLNTPLRPPTHQVNQPDMPQLNANQQFGQPIDPRTMQGNQRQSGPGSAAFAAMFNSIPQDQQQRLQTLPQDKLNEVVSKWHQQRMNAGNGQAGRPSIPMQDNPQVRPGSQVQQPGQFNPQNGANQFAMGNTGQRPPQAGMQAGMTPQQQMVLQQQMVRLQQQNALQQRTGPGGVMPNEQRIMMQMDSMDFPTLVYTHAQMPRGIPPDVKKWGPLKQWAQGNPNVSPESLEHIRHFQRMHYQQMVKTRAGMQPGQQIGAQPIGQAGQGGMPMVPPGMSAPVAHMGQNPMQIGNGMAPAQMRQPTQQEIQHARNQGGVKMAQATDDQIRNFLMRHNNQVTPQQQQQQQQQQRQAQLLQMQMANQAAQGQQPRPGLPQGQAPPTGVGQIPQPKQAQVGPDSAAPNSTAANNNRSVRPPTSARAAPPNASPAQPSKNNLKRASSDDVVEVPNPNTQQPNRSVPQPSQSQQAMLQPPRQLTPQQLATMDPEARKVYEQSVQKWKAQRMTQANSEDIKRLKVFSMEETQRAQEYMPDIPMDSQTKEKMVELLKQIHYPLSNVAKAVPRWFAVTHDENRARMFFRARHRLAKQFKDNEMTQPKDVFSIRPSEVEQARLMLSSMVKDLSDRFPAMKKDASQQGHSVAPTQPHVPAVLPPVVSTVPLNAANLQQQQQQLNKMHQRSGSRSSHTPAAPTSSQPPFAIGASSPRGTPTYIGKPPVTQEHLHIPARKKQKQNNTGQNTPGSNASPQVNKVPSPEIKRQPESKPQPKPALCCSEPECDRHNVGFDSEKALRLHTQEEHIQPLENPVKYASDNLASLLGLDSQGRVKTSNSGRETGAAAGVKMGLSGSKQGQIPNIKGESTPGGGGATPVNRQTVMNRQPSTAGGKPSATSNPKGHPDSAKDILTKLQAGQQDHAKQGTQQAQEAATSDPWADATIDPHELFQSFQGFESGAGGAISDMNVYRSITPNDTPESSKDGVSEPNSDISDGVGLDISLDIFDENWQPFGPSDIDLLDMSSFDVNGEEDLLMFEEDKPALNFQSWDDIEMPNFDKPFTFDTTMYSMYAD